MAKNTWKLPPDKAKKKGSSPLTADEVKTLSDNFVTAAGGTHTNLGDVFRDDDGQVRKGEFFGEEALDALLKEANKISGNKCVGIRFYYSLGYEQLDADTGESTLSVKGSGRLRPRLVAVAVDENGADIVVNLAGLKSEPSGSGSGGGLPTPPFGTP